MALDHSKWRYLSVDISIIRKETKSDADTSKFPSICVTLNVFSSRMYVPHNTRLNGSVISV